MTADKVEQDTFKLPHHKLKQNNETKLKELLKEYDSQFAQDETSIRTTSLTEMTIDTETSEPVSQKPCSIAMKHYQWFKDEKNKLLMAKVIWGSQSSWLAPIIVVPKGDGGKHLVIDYHALNKVTWKFIWPMPNVEDIFFPIKWSKVLLNIGPLSRIPPYSLGWIVNTWNSIHLTFWKIWVHKSTFWSCASTTLFPRTYDRCLKRFLLQHCLSGHHYLQQNSRRTP